MKKLLQHFVLASAFSWIVEGNKVIVNLQIFLIHQSFRKAFKALFSLR